MGMIHNQTAALRSTAAECRKGATTKVLAWLLGIAGLFASAAYGQGPQQQGQSLASATGRLDMAQAAIVARLRDPDVLVRQSAIFALQAIGPKAKPAIPALAELLRDRDGYIRSDASHALVSLGPEAVPSVMGVLCDEDARVRELAVRTLREFGEDAKDAIPALIARLGDRDATVRQTTILALQAIGPKLSKAAIPALAVLLCDKDGYVRIDAAHTLVRMGIDAVPSVTAMLCDADPRVRELALRTLQDIEER
jgi:HEAT repeat protein